MVHRRCLIALGAFASTLLVAASATLGAGLVSRPGSRPVPILASAPTTLTPPGSGPTTLVAPSTSLAAPAATTTSTPPPTVARTTLPPATAAPRPPTTPAAPRPTVAPAPRSAVVAAASGVLSLPSGTQGSASDYALIGYRWNPCQVVTVSSTGPDVSGVVAELAGITGLHLQVVGSGGEITVSWGATPAGGEVGQTDWRSVGAWMVSANITLNQLGMIYLPTLLRHELGHALGLAHAAHSNEIMYGTVGVGSPTSYQAGDLAGLRAVGASAGC